MISALRTIVVGAVVLVLVAIATFELALYLRPTLNSEGHRSMAIGHALVALVAGALAAVIAMVIDRRVFRRVPRADEL